MRYDQNDPSWRDNCIPFSACVDADAKINGSVGNCRKSGCKGEWGFDASITMYLWVMFRNLPGLPSTDSPGYTLQGHEEFHVQDFMRWCINADKMIKTEGFQTKGQCQAARDGLENTLKQWVDGAYKYTKATQDNHK